MSSDPKQETHKEEADEPKEAEEEQPEEVGY
jgi:hypothetical protein